MAIDPALAPAPTCPAWTVDVTAEVIDMLTATADLRDELAPTCTLSGPGLDEKLAVLSLSWELSRTAVYAAAEAWGWACIAHLHAHATWGPLLEP